jgi:hypothetical protein
MQKRRKKLIAVNAMVILILLSTLNSTIRHSQIRAVDMTLLIAFGMTLGALLMNIIMYVRGKAEDKRVG